MKPLKRFRFQMIFISGWRRKRPATKVTCDESDLRRKWRKRKWRRRKCGAEKSWTRPRPPNADAHAFKS